MNNILEERAIQAPCRYCKERHAGCHADCMDYKGYREEIDARNSKRKEWREKELEADLYKHESIRKARKRRNQKNK